METNTDGIPREHLRACPDHRVVAERGADCPCCATGVEARPEEFADENVSHEDVRWQIEPDTMAELLPIMRDYLEDRDEGALWVSVGQTTKDQIREMAGYNDPERWFNVVRYRYGMWIKTIMHEREARETIDNLRAEGYGDHE